jgi:hypothetical protein
MAEIGAVAVGWRHRVPMMGISIGGAVRYGLVIDQVKVRVAYDEVK